MMPFDDSIRTIATLLKCSVHACNSADADGRTRHKFRNLCMDDKWNEIHTHV